MRVFSGTNFTPCAGLIFTSLVSYISAPLNAILKRCSAEVKKNLSEVIEEALAEFIEICGYPIEKGEMR